jgi:biotin operon repressor
MDAETLLFNKMLEKKGLMRRNMLMFKFLKETKNPPTLKEIIIYLVEKDEKGISERTVNRSLAELRKHGVKIKSKLLEGKYVYVLE